MKILVLLLGLASLTFGYLIYFRKKYHLINDFKADFRAGRKDERYAKRVGLIELMAGILLVVVAVVLFLI